SRLLPIRNTTWRIRLPRRGRSSVSLGRQVRSGPSPRRCTGQSTCCSFGNAATLLGTRPLEAPLARLTVFPGCDGGRIPVTGGGRHMLPSSNGDTAVALSAATIYRSSNGDRWRLIRENGRVFVRHEANSSSGGSVTDTDVDEFLSVGGSGPEYAALR